MHEDVAARRDLHRLVARHAVLARHRLRGGQSDFTSLSACHRDRTTTATTTSAGATKCRPGRRFDDYGVVALSEKVSVLLYVPARSTSPAPMA